MKLFPLGFSDYKQLLDENRYYIDKTLLIADLIKFGGAVTLIPRPRRFGKTVNMSMLKYFFERTEQSHRYLFEDKKIWHEEQLRGMQGQFPLIFLTFKDIRATDWASAYDKFKHLIADEYERHSYLLATAALSGNEKALFERITSLTAPESEYQNGLLYLSRFLTSHYHEKTVILIDEYDLPLHEGLLHHYYDEVVRFIRLFLGAGLKDNLSLKLSVITGVLHTAKEGIFSGLNNPTVFSLLDLRFADKFGFTDEEISQLLRDYHLESMQDEFRSWYDGYLIGETKIYNPWSTLSCMAASGKLLAYWVNTGSQALISQIIASSSPQVKEACGILLRGNAIEKVPIDDKIVLTHLKRNPNAIWFLLLFSGYLTANSFQIENGQYYVDLILPNRELAILFKRMIADLFEESLDQTDLISLKDALQNADGELFATLLSKFIAQSMSWHDISENEPEKSYHLFVLGLLVLLADSYIIRSNRESGYGRYDIMIIPRKHSLPGYIIEFKIKGTKESFEECAERALMQIKSKNYAAELEAANITKIVYFGIACSKKRVLLKSAAHFGGYLI
jgi:hypothetical protein